MTIVFRASSIGHACPRKLWYEAVKHIEPVFDTRTLRIFRMGDAVEGLAVEWLREDGWLVEHNSGSQDAEREMILRIDDGVEIRGHHDAIITNDSGRFVVDVKSMNDRAYAEWVKKGTAAKYPQYLQQIHCYGKGLDIRKLAIMGVNKNTSEYRIESFDFNDQIWSAIRDKAIGIAWSEAEPEIPATLPKWCCSYCSYRGAPCQ